MLRNRIFHIAAALALGAAVITGLFAAAAGEGVAFEAGGVKMTLAVTQEAGLKLLFTPATLARS